MDDQESAHKLLERFIDLQSDFVLEEKFTNPFDALNYLKSNKVDVVFLDVDMPELSGMDFLSIIESSTEYGIPATVLTTGHTEMALPALQRSTLTRGFLAKPFGYDEFKSTIDKLKKLTTLERTLSNAGGYQNGSTFIKVSTGGQSNKYEKITSEEIYFIKGGANYPSIYTADHHFVTRSTLFELEEVFRGHLIQVHRSYLVNPHYITFVQARSVTVGTEYDIPLGPSYRKKLFDSLD